MVALPQGAARGARGGDVTFVRVSGASNDGNKMQAGARAFNQRRSGGVMIVPLRRVYLERGEPARQEA
jgi:hypothetical protein